MAYRKGAKNLQAEVYAKVKDAFVFIKGEHPALHPGQCARIMQAGQEVGIFGALHPQIAQKLDISTPVFLFEILLSAATQAQIPAVYLARACQL